jgi:hypothetical protein
MDRNENLYFDDFSKKSLSEIQEMFQNLKHIGMSDEDIEKYAKQYKEFFESRVKATGFEHIDGKLMERGEIKKTLRDELINLKKDEN